MEQSCIVSDVEEANTLKEDIIVERTDFFLEFNDNNNTDPRVIWDAYKAYMWDPLKSIPALIECVNKFGKISGYKVNYGKSEIIPLNTVDQGEPTFIKPFRWAPTGLKYLGIHITPRTSQLYAENINPIIIHIKDKLLRWKKLPISFLGRVNLIKMIILPKLIYPVSMLFLFIEPKDLAGINKAISEFIWAGRKPKIKMEVLQLPPTSGGWGLPKVENYVLSIHARIISLWAIQKKNINPWLEIEESVCKPYRPINMLNKQYRELPLMSCFWTVGGSRSTQREPMYAQAVRPRVELEP
uniref:Reverse transcriptase domain-containing protein n=1 Tax=Fundulus heteroclitus TaxID=8078 RepID=A0A3Q2PJ43_FUNHE